jgi:hypothetical protein
LCVAGRAYRTEGGGEGASEKAWSSINHSLFSVYAPKFIEALAKLPTNAEKRYSHLSYIFLFAPLPLATSCHTKQTNPPKCEFSYAAFRNNRVITHKRLSVYVFLPKIAALGLMKSVKKYWHLKKLTK